jgi:8-oxo-dGTP pyrophosphatase MutT (NUDIX family)
MTGEPARPRLAAGALFVKDAHLLLVHKTYANGWDVPGGVVDHGESPAAACRRELHEELGLDRAPVRLLVHDWAPSGRADTADDKILYLFCCGPLGPDEASIRLDGVELDAWAWVPVDRIGRYVIPRLARRLTCAYTAHREGSGAVPRTRQTSTLDRPVPARPGPRQPLENVTSTSRGNRRRTSLPNIFY